MSWLWVSKSCKLSLYILSYAPDKCTKECRSCEFKVLLTINTVLKCKQSSITIRIQGWLPQYFWYLKLWSQGLVKVSHWNHQYLLRCLKDLTAFSCKNRLSNCYCMLILCPDSQTLILFKINLTLLCYDIINEITISSECNIQFHTFCIKIELKEQQFKK